MYLEKLFDIRDSIPSITTKNALEIDNFLGDIGTGNIFEKKSLLYKLTQKQLINPIIDWLQEINAIKPYKQTCPNCSQEYNYPIKKCDVCGADLTSTDSITTYKIIEPLVESERVKEAKKQTINPLDISAYKILLKSLDKKIRDKSQGFILFVDLANSTKLAEANKNFQVSIIKGLNKYLEEEVKTTFRKSKAIYIKGNGDSSYLYFDNLKELEQYLYKILKNLEKQSFSEKVRQINNEHDWKVFYKIYIANSEIEEYKRPDILSLDFEAMEAFTFIARIEKQAEDKIKNSETENTIYPCFIATKNNYFDNQKSLHLSDVKDYKEVDIYYCLGSEFLNNMKNSYD